MILTYTLMMSQIVPPRNFLTLRELNLESVSDPTLAGGYILDSFLHIDQIRVSSDQ